MNLLLLDQFSDPGGAQLCLLELLAAIRRAGWNATVGLPGEGDLFRRVQDLGFPTARIRCGPYASGNKSAADAARFLFDVPRLAAQMKQLAAEVEADLLYLNGPRLLPAAAFGRPRIPVLFHSHSLVPAGSMRSLVGASLRRVKAHVVGSCRFAAGQWRYFVPADHISVVYNGVAGPSDVSRPERSEPRIGCIGRIAPEKGQREFLAAARMIHASVPAVRFVIAGAALFGDAGASEYESAVRRDAKGLPVEFAGWTGDVYRTLAGLDILLVPSTGQEATTRVILEAYAAGVPVVAFQSGGISEVVTPESGGYLVKSSEEMANAAIALLREPDPGIAGRARGTWRERFTLERYQRELIAAIESAVKKKVVPSDLNPSIAHHRHARP